MPILDATQLRDALAPLSRFGRAVELHDRIDSTSTRLAELAAGGAEDGALVIAREQRAGRGRLGRSFASPPGGLYASALLRQAELPGDAPISLLTGLAISQAIDELARVATELKWPNDVLLNGKKVAGVLTEAGQDGSQPRLIVGFGINANTPLKGIPFLLRASATSVLLEAQLELDLDELLRAVLSWLEGHLLARAEKKGPYLIGQISDRMPLIGAEVRATVGRESVTGVALALTSSGALLVDTSAGRRTITAGEVERLR